MEKFLEKLQSYNIDVLTDDQLRSSIQKIYSLAVQNKIKKRIMTNKVVNIVKNKFILNNCSLTYEANDLRLEETDDNIRKDIMAISLYKHTYTVSESKNMLKLFVNPSSDNIERTSWDTRKIQIVQTEIERIKAEARKHLIQHIYDCDIATIDVINLCIQNKKHICIGKAHKIIDEIQKIRKQRREHKLNLDGKPSKALYLVKHKKACEVLEQISGNNTRFVTPTVFIDNMQKSKQFYYDMLHLVEFKTNFNMKDAYILLKNLLNAYATITSERTPIINLKNVLTFHE